jgi:hypothetical protein
VTIADGVAHFGADGPAWRDLACPVCGRERIATVTDQYRAIITVLRRPSPDAVTGMLVQCRRCKRHLEVRLEPAA